MYAIHTLYDCFPACGWFVVNIIVQIIILLPKMEDIEEMGSKYCFISFTMLTT